MRSSCWWKTHLNRRHIRVILTTTMGIYVVPAFTGLGAPYWNQMLVVLSFWLDSWNNQRRLYQGIQSIAYQVGISLIPLRVDSKTAIQVLKVDGGQLWITSWCSFQPGYSRYWYRSCQNMETAALGAAFLAGITGLGYWKDLDELRELNATGELLPGSYMNWSRKEQLYKGDGRKRSW